MKTTVIKELEYDEEGKVVKETITTTTVDEPLPIRPWPGTVYPYTHPQYPQPPSPPVQPWNPGRVWCTNDPGASLHS